MENLTARQKQVLEAIHEGIEERGYAPTVRQIGAVVGLSSSCTVKKHIDKLIEKGHLGRDRYHRNIVVMENGRPVSRRQTASIPLLGRVAGGAPVLAQQEPAPQGIALPASLLKQDHSGQDMYALEVYGNSMQGAGITDGDYVVVHRQHTAADGDIVVALIGEEATIKTFYHENDRIRLQPENPDFAPIYTKDVQILGKVTMSIKRFD